jgi:hypothetical protein
MAAYRYWRLWFWSRQQVGGVSIASLAEAVWRDTPGGPNVASGGLITSSTSTAIGPSFLAANLIDGNTTTVYATQANVGAFEYDFGSPIDIVEVLLTLAPTGSTYPGSTHGPEAIRLDYSPDRSIYAPATSVITAPGGWVDGGTELLVAGPPVVTAPKQPGLAIALAPTLPQTLGLAASQPGGTIDVEDGGTLRIAGAVKIDGSPPVPVRRRVRLYHQLSGRLVRETWSDATTGAYAFEKLAPAEYEVRANDHTLIYDPAAVDRRVPVP